MKTTATLSQEKKDGIALASSRTVSFETILLLVIGLVTIAIQLFHLVFLTTHPPLFIDESWNANAAWTWLQTGVNFDSMHAGTLDRYGYEWLRWPTFGNVPWLISFAAFRAGTLSTPPGFLDLRYIVGPSHLSGRPAQLRRHDRRLVCIGGFAELALPPGEPLRALDIMVALLAMAAFGLALVGLQDDRWYAHVLAGLLIGLSLDVHLNGVLFAPALAAVYLVAYRSRFLVKSGTWWCALGGLLGIAFFAAIKILPNPDAYFAQFNFSYAFTHKLPIAGFNPLDLLRSLDDEIGRYHFYDNSLDFALIGAAVAFLVVRRSELDRLLVTYVGVAFAAFVLFVGNKHDVYAILLYPLFMLMVAATFVSLLREERQFSAQRVFVGALLGLLLVNSGVHVAREVMTTRSYDYATL